MEQLQTRSIERRTSKQEWHSPLRLVLDVAAASVAASGRGQEEKAGVCYARCGQLPGGRKVARRAAAAAAGGDCSRRPVPIGR